MNKPGYKSSTTGRRKNKESGKTRPPPQIKSVLFVPERGGTPPETERGGDHERPGTQISRIFCQRNPWSGDDCGRPDCLVCVMGRKVAGTARDGASHTSTPASLV